jgi:flagellar motor switch/type III secretory pathway protein FliN
MSSDTQMPDLLDELAPLERITLCLRAELDRTTMSHLELQRLTVGSLIRLPNSAGEMISVHSGDVRLGSGEVLVVDGVLTVRMSEIHGRSGVPEMAEPERARAAKGNKA